MNIIKCCICLLTSPLINTSNTVVHFSLHHTVHLHTGSMSAERVRQGEVGRDHPQGDMHMVVARIGCKSAMVGTRWANSCPGCMDRLSKTPLSPCRGFISCRKGCLGSEHVFDDQEC